MSDIQITPPLGPDVPKATCGWELEPEPALCGKPGQWHIFWTTDLENSTACQEHYEASKQWAWYTAHVATALCLSEEPAQLIWLANGDSACIHDDDVDELLAAMSRGETPEVALDSGRLVPVEVPA